MYTQFALLFIIFMKTLQIQRAEPTIFAIYETEMLDFVHVIL